jgi:hypothetical protein
MRRREFVAGAAVALGAASCQYLPKVLPIVADIITEIIDAKDKLDKIDAAAQAWFKQYPNDDMKKKWLGAMDKARAAIDAALKAAHGVESVAEKDLMAAMQKFVQAWQTLSQLATSIGFMGAGGTLNAGPASGHVLEEPLAVKRSRGES